MDDMNTVRAQDQDDLRDASLQAAREEQAREEAAASIEDMKRQVREYEEQDMKRQVREYEERVGQPAPNPSAFEALTIPEATNVPQREPRTIDGEVLPISLDFGDLRKDEQAPEDNALANAIAAHFGIEPSQITGFVAAVEHTGDEGITLSSVWSLGVPVWRLRAFARELGEHLKQV